MPILSDEAIIALITLLVTCLPFGLFLRRLARGQHSMQHPNSGTISHSPTFPLPIANPMTDLELGFDEQLQRHIVTGLDAVIHPPIPAHGMPSGKRECRSMLTRQDVVH
jgi:hypothetical protein